MRVKTVPRHRILQSNVEVMSATKTSINNESLMDIKNEHDPKYNTINVQSPYQTYTSPTILIPIMMSATTSSSEITLSSSTSTSPSLCNDDNNNVEVVNLSTKDSHNRTDESATTGIPVEPEDRLKDTFLYKIMTDPNFLENIQQRSKLPKKFCCAICKEVFATCEELTNHMDTKKNDSNQIVCCACKKTFAEKRYLKYHQRCHSERTKFTCDICTRKYTRLDNLTRHNVLHVNPDKFSCTTCNRTFTRKDLLNKHRKSHEKYNLYCEKCGKYFRRNLTLANHQKLHREMSDVSIDRVSCINTDGSLTSIEKVICKTENKIATDNAVCTIGNIVCGENLCCEHFSQ